MSKFGGMNSSKSMIIRCDTHPFHVTSRTHDQNYFPLELNEVWEVMIKELNYLQQNHSLCVHAFILMGNHFHLLCQTPKGNLTEVMQRFLISTSKRIGNHWQEGFNWSLIESQTHYFQVYRYIFQNPVRANICNRVEDYKFSTLHESRLPIHSFITMSFGGSEGEYHWLNERYDQDQESLIQLGLKKMQFDIAKRRVNAFNKLSVPKVERHE